MEDTKNANVFKTEQQSKVDDVMACFHEGFNCSQAILSTYCEEFGLDKKTALKIACGLGAGMGRLGETCGAVSGAYLLIGLKYGKYMTDDEAAKEKTYETVREFNRLFEAKNKTTICRELLGVDLISGDKMIASERVKTVCPKMIQDAAEILESLMFQPERK
ncbi:MAG: C-GCAxxG-C-C family protein [Methanimicrococcus sp.]|nr:C-GCAxxG-C-C family protein [Methanimicrococcus sp.]